MDTKIIYDDQIMLLSHTVTPEIDSVSVLKDYSIEYFDFFFTLTIW